MIERGFDRRRMPTEPNGRLVLISRAQRRRCARRYKKGRRGARSIVAWLVFALALAVVGCGASALDVATASYDAGNGVYQAVGPRLLGAFAIERGACSPLPKDKRSACEADVETRWAWRIAVTEALYAALVEAHSAIERKDAGGARAAAAKIDAMSAELLAVIGPADAGGDSP
jgi:hypothetical protein